jgi:hypothetical protein
VSITSLDPFELPDWLAGEGVVWESDQESEQGLASGHLIRGVLQVDGTGRLPCALLAVDEAYPTPVAPDDVRTAAHQAWHHGQVHLVEQDRVVTVAVPGRRFDAERVMEALARCARAVGASPEEWTVLLRLGSARR